MKGKQDMEIKKVSMNGFCKNSPAQSSFFTGTDEELVELVMKYRLNHFAPHPLNEEETLFRCAVPMGKEDLHLFRAAEVELQEGMELQTVYESRQAGETPRLFTFSPADSLPVAKGCYIALYQTAAIKDGGFAYSLDPENLTHWEIVGIFANAHGLTFDSDRPDFQPMGFHVMCHNQFGSSGGSAKVVSAEQQLKELKDSFNWHKGLINLRVIK